MKRGFSQLEFLHKFHTSVIKICIIILFKIVPFVSSIYSSLMCFSSVVHINCKNFVCALYIC